MLLRAFLALILIPTLALSVSGQPREVQEGPAPPRFTFKIDAKAVLSELVPAAPKTPAKLPAWDNEDLAKVSELAFADPIAKDLDKMKAMEKTAHILAKVNHLNRKKTDGFMLALLEQRGDLRGLPFLMGEECRTREEQARAFREMADIVNQQLFQCKAASAGSNAGECRSAAGSRGAFPRRIELWNTMSKVNGPIQRGNLAKFRLRRHFHQQKPAQPRNSGGAHADPDAGSGASTAPAWRSSSAPCRTPMQPRRWPGSRSFRRKTKCVRPRSRASRRAARRTTRISL